MNCSCDFQNSFPKCWKPSRPALTFHAAAGTGDELIGNDMPVA